MLGTTSMKAFRTMLKITYPFRLNTIIIARQCGNQEPRTPFVLVMSMTPPTLSFPRRPLVSDSHSEVVTTCWNCATKVHTPLHKFPVSCSKCECLQKYSKDQMPNYFSILGQPLPGFKVDLDSLSRNMKDLQRRLHPDLFGGRAKEEQELSQDLSSFINQAIVTLQNPIQRGLYLLSLRGVNVDLETQQTLDREFLSEVMDLNEELEALSSSEQWLEFRRKNEKTLNLLEQELGEAFDLNDLNRAQRLLFRMTYYETMGLKLKELQGKFNVVD